MASGFMTLPLPILGNTYAMVKTSGGNENTLNQRGTPAIYWASLWNRCLGIVDNHDHNSGDTSTYGTNASYLGKPLIWGSPLDGGTGGILVSHDFDLFGGPELKINGIRSSYAVKDLKMAALSKYANIIDDTSTFRFTTSYIDSISRPYIAGLDGRAIYGSRDFPLNNPWEYGGSIYTRNRIAYNDITGSGTGYATNFNYVPQLELIWNNAGASKEGTVIVDNSPAGDRFAAWKVVQATGNQSENSGTFTGWYDNDGSGGEGGVRKSGLNPYNGINDRGHNGYNSYTYTWGGGTGGLIGGYILAGYGSFVTGASYYAGTSNISFGSYSALAKDYRLELPQPITKSWWRGSISGTGDDDHYFSPYTSLNWFSTAHTEQYHQGMPSGKFWWVSDYYGQNATNPLDIFLFDSTGGGTGKSCELRWFSSTGVAKYGYQDPTGTGYASWLGDTLQLATNFGSLLIVHYDFVYDVVANVPQTTGKDKFFAYFVPN